MYSLIIEVYINNQGWGNYFVFKLQITITITLFWIVQLQLLITITQIFQITNYKLQLQLDQSNSITNY